MLKKLFVLVAVIVALFSLSSQRINAASKCFDDTTGKFTTWAKCLGGINGTTVDPVGKTIENNAFLENPLYTGFVDNFYMSYFQNKYNTWCNTLNCLSASQVGQIKAASNALNDTTNRIVADIFFAIISVITIIFLVKLVIAIMKYASAGDSEEVVKTQKKVINSMLFGIGMIIIFLIIAEILTRILGLGDFWSVGFQLRTSNSMFLT